MDQEVKLVIGLGKPGRSDATKYSNAGFIVIDNAVRKAVNTFPRFAMTNWKTTRKYMILSLKIEPLTLLVKPRTFEANTPRTVKKLIDYYEVEPEDLAFVYADKGVEFGKCILDKKDTKNEWIEDIADYIDLQDYLRVKVGISGKNEDAEITDIDRAVFEKVGENLLQSGFGLKET